MPYFGHAPGRADDLCRAQDDTDWDKRLNLQELLAGTNPTNGAPVLRVAPVVGRA